MLGLSGVTPATGTRPCVGRSALTPQNDAGLRSEPPVSVPSAASTIPAATATAEPPLEPPGMRSRSHGLRQAPHAWFCVVAPKLSCSRLAFATTTAPAARSRRTAVASAAAGAGWGRRARRS